MVSAMHSKMSPIVEGILLCEVESASARGFLRPTNQVLVSEIPAQRLKAYNHRLPLQSNRWRCVELVQGVVHLP